MGDSDGGCVNVTLRFRVTSYLRPFACSVTGPIRQILPPASGEDMGAGNVGGPVNPAGEDAN